MAIKTGIGLVEYAKSKIGTPYVYGAKMEVLTKERFDWLQKTYGKNCVWDSDVNKIGKVCCDCSGLISAYSGIVQGSAQMKTTAKEYNPITTINHAPIGALVWQDGHVGIYIGLENGVPMYIAEDGSAYGCRKNQLSKAKFTHWLLMNYIDYAPIKKEDDEMLSEMKLSVNGGPEKTIPSILKDGHNYPDLWKLADELNIKVGYNDSKKLVTITK